MPSGADAPTGAMLHPVVALEAHQGPSRDSKLGGTPCGRILVPFKCLLVASEHVVEDAAAILVDEVAAHRDGLRTIKEHVDADPRVRLTHHHVRLDRLVGSLLLARS